jgi:hypothetical protein
VAFNPEIKDYLLGTTLGGKAFLMKVNSVDGTMVKEQEIDLEMDNCINVAFNKKGSIAVVVGLSNESIALEFSRNISNPD